MFHRIMVALDGSSVAEAVLPLVARLAGATGAGLILLRVTHEADGAFEPESEDAARYWQAMHAAQEYLATVRLWPELRDLSISLAVAGGQTVPTIVEQAKTFNADLLAIAPHGRSDLGRIAFGSVADEILRAFPGDLLIVRPAPDSRPPRLTETSVRVVVPLDGSKLAEQALPTAVTLAQRLEAELALVRVVVQVPAEGVATPSGAFVESVTDEQLDEAQAAAAAYLDSVAAALRPRGAIVSRHVPIGYSIPEEIEVVAMAASTPLVVMTAHGRSGLGCLLHGSVAEAIVRHSHVPVLMERTSARAARSAARDESNQLAA